ncbi:MAG: diphthine synthase [Thermoprotei archaeon]|nr:MAG: diphthine synthase [Thermoprotei archaeon]
MTLYFVGLGLSISHLTLKAIEVLRKVDKIYIDTYTNIVPDFDLDVLKSIIGSKKKFVFASRKDLEGVNISRIVDEARENDIAILVPGDPFIATTHDAIRVEALSRGVSVETVHGISIYSAIASATGLQAYRFGKTVTLVRPSVSKPFSVIETIYANLKLNLHTLVLLDLKLEEGYAMTINEAVEILRELEKEYSDEQLLRGVIGIGVARLATRDQVIKADLLYNLKNYSYPPPPHSIVIVAKPHPIELDLLKYIGDLPDNIYQILLKSKEYPL